MKLIGKGYWYNVFSLENDKVLKIEKGFFQKIKDSYQLEGNKKVVWLFVLFKLLTGREKICNYYSYIRHNVDLKLVGSPKFLEKINYEQDIVQKIGVVFEYSDIENKKRFINLYISNIIDCWRNGFADTTYNFTVNNGIDKKGNLILIDFNEISLCKEEVMVNVISKKWLHAWSFKKIDPETQEYFKQKMDLFITPESLNKNWKN